MIFYQSVEYESYGGNCHFGSSGTAADTAACAEGLFLLPVACGAVSAVVPDILFPAGIGV